MPNGDSCDGVEFNRKIRREYMKCGYLLLIHVFK